MGGRCEGFVSYVNHMKRKNTVTVLVWREGDLQLEEEIKNGDGKVREIDPP